MFLSELAVGASQHSILNMSIELTVDSLNGLATQTTVEHTVETKSKLGSQFHLH